MAPELLRICSLIQADGRVPAGEGGSHAEVGSGEVRSGRALGPGADRDCGPGPPGSLPLHSPPRHQGCTAAAPDVLGQRARRQLSFSTGLTAWRQGTGAPGQPRPHLDSGLQRGQRNQPAQAPRTLPAQSHLVPYQRFWASYPLGVAALLTALQGCPWGWVCYAVGQYKWTHDNIL